jgi:hypothetical protein
MITGKRIRSGVPAQGLLLAALALTGAWLAGCSTTVYKPGDRAADSVQAAAIQARTESQGLAGTMSSLSNLVDKPAPDLKPQFQSFNSALRALVAAAKQGDAAGNRLAGSNAYFFAAWDKQLTTITNADVRSRSEARRKEVSNQFNAAHSHYVQAQDALRSLINYLQDIRRALSTDLTAKGVEAVKPPVASAAATAAKVQTALTEANTELTALSSQMSSSRWMTGGQGAL